MKRIAQTKNLKCYMGASKVDTPVIKTGIHSGPVRLPDEIELLKTTYSANTIFYDPTD